MFVSSNIPDKKKEVSISMNMRLHAAGKVMAGRNGKDFSKYVSDLVRKDICKSGNVK